MAVFGSHRKQNMEVACMLCSVKPTGSLVWSCSCTEQTCWGFSFYMNDSVFWELLSDGYMTEPIRRRKPVSCCVLKFFCLQFCSPTTPFFLSNVVFTSHFFWFLCPGVYVCVFLLLLFFSACVLSLPCLSSFFAVFICPLSLYHLEKCMKGDRETEEKLRKRFFSISAGTSAVYLGGGGNQLNTSTAIMKHSKNN